jgi:hypothetical protein
LSSIGDFVRGVVVDVLQDLLKKPTGKRAKRRKGTATRTAPKRTSAKSTPAKRQTSRKSTVRARSKAKQRSY